MRVFLCHSSGDKPPVRDLCRKLAADGFDPWLDEQQLLPGQDWSNEIVNAIHQAHAVVICLSRASVSKEGYLQREVKYALDAVEEKPEGTIFLIPVKLEECDIPQRLSRWQWTSLFEPDGYQRLVTALRRRAEGLWGGTAVRNPPRRLRSEKAAITTNQAKVMMIKNNY
ncbi:MAG: hypothetical protein C5B51_24895, partial [Terriglobia bacterium]